MVMAPALAPHGLPGDALGLSGTVRSTSPASISGSRWRRAWRVSLLSPIWDSTCERVLSAVLSRERIATR